MLGVGKEWLKKNPWVWDHRTRPPSYGGLLGGLMEVEHCGEEHVNLFGRCIVTGEPVSTMVRFADFEAAMRTGDIRGVWPNAASWFWKFMETGISDDAWKVLAFRRYCKPCRCAYDPKGTCGLEPCVFCEMTTEEVEDC